MPKSEKTQITECFKIIEKKKFGLVLTANSRKPIPIGLRGLVDHLIITSRHTIWVEVKLPGDALSERQKELKKYLLHLSGLKSSRVEYRIITSIKQAQDLTDKIVTNSL